MPHTLAEHWSTDAGSADVATLDIAPSLQRERIFEIDVRFVVRVPAAATAPWHALRVEFDGLTQWQRRINSHNPGHSDSLDWRTRCVLAPGRALRVRASTQVGGVQRQRLVLDAEERLDDDGGVAGAGASKSAAAGAAAAGAAAGAGAAAAAAAGAERAP